MAKLDIVQLDKELKQGKIRSFYIIVGNENHLAFNSQKRIEEAVKSDSQHELSSSSFEGKSFSYAKFLDSFRAIPLFGNRQLVIIRSAEGMPKEAQEKLSGIFNESTQAATAIFIALKIDGRSKFMQAAIKSPNVGVVECKPLYPNQIPSWINMELRRFKKHISQEAACYLADIVGTDLGALTQALEHVTLFVGARPTVELKDVEEAIAETTQRTVFELTDAIGSRNEKRALAVLKNLLDYGAQPIMILNMIARHFRILTKAKEVEGRGSPYEIASYLGVKPFFAKNYLAQSQKFETSELRETFKNLSKCDRALKSSRIPKDRILEKLILDL